MNNKSKQKSILDYFKTNSNQLKRTNDSLNNSVFKEKIIRFEDNNDISIVDEKLFNYKNNNENKTIGQNMRRHEIQSFNDSIEESIDFEQFIDTNQFLEIDFRVTDQQLSPSYQKTSEDNESNDSYYMKGSYIYDNFRLMIDSVLEDQQYVHLFDSNDWKVIESFTSLTGFII
jgi:hypothetical protein